MKILFIHQNFPAQFRHLAPKLALEHEVVAMHINQTTPLPNIRYLQYKIERGTSKDIHPLLSDVETKVIRAEAAFKAAQTLKESGFNPDLIIAHPGWGESLFIKEVWPQSKLAIYCEFFYHMYGADVNFDPEFPIQNDVAGCRLRLKNANHVLHFQMADAGISPTHWQKSVFPEPFRSNITVIHDGINTNIVAPRPDITLTISTNQGNIELSRNDEIITFVNRNLEPYRGYHTFMRALPEVLRTHPKARVLIVGGNSVSYGSPPTDGGNWKDVFLNEVKEKIDLDRVHFLGQITYPAFLSLLQLSMVHVYLTYPFVLSWSLLEAMSTGCAIIASDTPPVREVIEDGKTGELIDFLDVNGLAKKVIHLLENPKLRQELGARARQFAIENYDLETHCLPAQLKWVDSLLNKK